MSIGHGTTGTIGPRVQARTDPWGRTGARGTKDEPEAQIESDSAEQTTKAGMQQIH